MRKFSPASVATILAIALYFTLFWGYDGWRMLTSPTYGLDEVWRSQFVFAIGSLMHLSPVGLIKLAAFFAVLKLAVAAICMLHILDRFRCLGGGQADSDILEAALMLVVAISIIAVGPAVWSHNADLVREYVIQLALAALAVALCTVERGTQRRAEDAERAEALRERLGTVAGAASPFSG